MGVLSFVVYGPLFFTATIGILLSLLLLFNSEPWTLDPQGTEVRSFCMTPQGWLEVRPLCCGTNVISCSILH